MCYQSPAKILRNVKRMTKFNESKPERLSITRLPSINVEPLQKNRLAFSQTVIVEINPEKKHQNLSIVNVCSTEVPPDPYPCVYCMRVPPRPNYPEPPSSCQTLPCCSYRCCAGSYALARNCPGLGHSRKAGDKTVCCNHRLK